MTENKSVNHFFERPFSSSFLFPESLGINNFTSTYPIPIKFKDYKKIILQIQIDISISKEVKIIVKKVGFYYNVDTIIKETLRTILNKLENTDNLAGLQSLLRDSSKKFVLKFNLYEEYIFGDYPIGTYETIRKSIREFEPINLILKVVDKSIVSPKLSHYPPIIYMSVEKKYNYLKLIKKYFKKYQDESIVFRFKPSKALKNIYMKKKMNRREALSKFCYSNESDFPLVITLKGISNLFSLKNHIDDEKYHEKDLELPYFYRIQNVKEQNKPKKIFNKYLNKLCAIFRNKKQSENTKDSENDHVIDVESVLRKYKRNIEREESLNHLDKKFLIEKRATVTRFFSESYSKNTKEKIKKLSSSSIPKNFSDNYILPFAPVFIKFKILLMLGSYKINKISTDFFLIQNDFRMNEKLNFKNLLISHLPRETRLCINLKVYDSKKKNSFIIASGQTSIYNEMGFINQKLYEVYVWPLYQIDFRSISMSQFLRKVEKNEIIKENFDKRDYCIIYLEFQSFIKPLAHTIKSPENCKDFLEVKYSKEVKFSTLLEVKNLFSTSIQDLEEIFKTMKRVDFNIHIQDDKKLKTPMTYKKNHRNLDSKTIRDKIYLKKKRNKFKIENEELNIYDYLDFSLDEVRHIIKKDPLEPLSKSERAIIIYSRDYICTIPSALEIFLRSIDWFSPLQVNLAKLYLGKWEKIDPEDAISLLDSRYPITFVREYAISIISEISDDLFSTYILQLCQCLMYELYHYSPLSDLLITRCLKSPNIVGLSFFWNVHVCMKNKLFLERLSVIITSIFMLSGPTFIERIYNLYSINREIKNIAQDAKSKNKTNKKKETTTLLKSQIRELDKKNFELPIHPSYYVESFVIDECTIFTSKMVPILLCCNSKDSDGSKFKVIYKCGDDLRQDVLTLQILKIMDKMWLDSGLDLKILTYKVVPTGIKEGFVEYVDANVIEVLQQREGVSGALDRELLIKHLRSVNPTDKFGMKKYDSFQQHNNFIRSLAGFCVATCVLGIGDRHPGNVMVKDNGIFFHIDYGHILGHFKYKFGIKRERAPFLLTPDMAHVYIKDQKDEEFKNLCVEAYLILRRNANRLINLLIIMSSAGLPELNGLHDVYYLKKMLQLDQIEEDAAVYFKGLINQSKNEKFRLLDNIIHNFKHG